jgi:hypothetical protein
MALPVCLRELSTNETGTEGRSWIVTDAVRIGRKTGLEIVLDNTSVSRVHAEIRPVEGQWQVIDSGSTNGTYRNSVRLGNHYPVLFRVGDVLQFGHMAFTVEMTEEFWLGATDPTTLLGRLRGSASQRKLRLFGCACVSSSRDRFSTPCFTKFWDEVRAAAYGLSDNSISPHEAGDLSRRINTWACSMATRSENFLAYAALIELLAETFNLKEEGGLFSGILGTYTIDELRMDTYRMDRPSLQQKAIYADCLRDIFGNPFRPVTLDPSWLTSTVVALAQAIYKEHAFDQMPILADALMDADCDNEDLLNHCRQPGIHVRGCWVLDAVLGMR